MPEVIIAAIVAAGTTAITVEAASTAIILLNAAIAAGAAAVNRYLLAPDAPAVSSARPETRSMIRAVRMAARWAHGTVRCGALIHFYGIKEPSGTDRRTALHLGLTLAEGPCTEVKGLWVDGEKVTFTRTARTGSGQSGYLIRPQSPSQYGGQFEIYEYLQADGTEGDSLRSAFPDDWTTDHKLHGKAWVHCVFYQYPYGNNQNRRFWTREPRVEFLLRGLQHTWPGTTTATNTGSVAAVRYWFQTVWKEILPEFINSASVVAAHSLCKAQITYTLPAGYEDFGSTDIRYSFNGFIHSDDDPERIEAELDFCWQGHVVEVNGEYFYRPGTDRSITRTLTEDECITTGSFQPQPYIHDRVNRASMSISQSKEHDFTPLSIPELSDDPARVRDADVLAEPPSASNTVAIGTDKSITFVGGSPGLTGVHNTRLILITNQGTTSLVITPVTIASGALQAIEAPEAAIAATDTWIFARDVNFARDFGEHPGLSSAIGAGRIIATQLRRARAAAVWTYQIMPGSSFEWYSVKPTDWVRVNVPSDGLLNVNMMVTRIVANPDTTVTLDLIEQPSGVYADTLHLPGLKPRGLAFPDPGVVPDVSNLSVDNSSVVNKDGTVNVTAQISWDKAAVLQTEVQWLKAARTSSVTRVTDLEFTIPDAVLAPQAVAVVGRTMWLVQGASSTRRDVKVYNRYTGEPLSDLDFELPTGFTVRGAVAGGTTLYVLAEYWGSAGAKIIRFDTTDGSRITPDVLTLHTDNGHPRGLAWGEGRWFIGDVVDDKIYVYSRITQGRLSSKEFNLTGANTVLNDLQILDRFMIAFDSLDDKFYQYSHWYGTYYTGSDITPSGIGSALYFWMDWNYIYIPVGSTMRVYQWANDDWTDYVSAGGDILISNLDVGSSYIYRARHIGIRGITGEWTDMRFHDITGDTTAPETPTGLTIVAQPMGFLLRWDSPSARDFKHSIITEERTLAEGTATNTLAIATSGATTFSGTAPPLSGLANEKLIIVITSGTTQTVYPMDITNSALVASPAPGTAVAATANWRFANLVELRHTDSDYIDHIVGNRNRLGVRVQHEDFSRNISAYARIEVTPERRPTSTATGGSASTGGFGDPWSGAGLLYKIGDFREKGDVLYECVSDHTSAASNAPDVQGGGTYWFPYDI